MRTAVWDAKANFEEYQNKEVFDCLLAEFLLSEGRHIPKLEETFQAYSITSLEELMKKQLEKLNEKPKLLELLNTVELPLVPILYAMEKAGITLDTKRLTEIGKEIDALVSSLDSEIKKEVGFEINLNSPLQVGNYLFEKAGVPLSKTKTGKYATNENELLKHQNQFPVIQKLLLYRELTKLRSTYCESLITKVDSNSKVHTTYSQVGANTGRLSSSNPNLQNIPVTSTIGQRIKSCFISSPRKTLLSFDYSQQELRILAHLTGEEKLIEAFKNNLDVHRITASQLFTVTYENVTKEQRAVGKTINFGIIYGMSSYGMSEGLQIPQEQASQFIENFYSTFPKIKSYYDNYLKQAMIDDYAETLFGRRRFVKLYPSQKFMDNQTRRILMNFPIQGTAADLMKMAMIKISHEVLSKNKEVKMLLQIHDDLVFEIEDNQELIKKISQEIKEAMCTTYPLIVPVEVDVKIGKRWGEMELLK